MEPGRADRRARPFIAVRRRPVRHPRLHGGGRQQRSPRPSADQPVRGRDAGQVRGPGHPARSRSRRGPTHRPPLGTDPGGHDRAVLAESLDLLRAMTADHELAAILGTPAHPDRHPLAGIASYCHPAGTCKMGPGSDKTVVVDTTGAVHGIEGLYVADASIMPSITRGNINLPTAMIGARIAAGILNLTPADIAPIARR